MAFSLPDLPYGKDALQPHISAETIDYHYGKHHNAYVTKLNAAIDGTEFASMSLEDIIKKSKGGMFNNAAQVYNHTFYWHCLSPNGGGAAKGEIAKAIDDTFGSFDKFKEEFTKKAATVFGSGWAWLAKNSSGKIEIVQTANAGCPLTDGYTPLLTCDVWEHAYYVDYRNARPKYLDAFWNLVNWDWVNDKYSA